MEDPIRRLKQQAEGLPSVPQPFPVNLPDIPIDGQTPDPALDERLAVLSQARRIIERAFQEAGYRLIGSGFGMRDGAYGETDIGLEYAGYKLEVRAYLPKP